MQVNWHRSLAFLLLFFSGSVAAAQVKQDARTVVINGHSGQATVLQINGRTYVDVETLARIGQGSVTFQGNQIALTTPASSANASTTSPEPEHAQPSGLSRDFIVAGIETLARMREWATTLAYAIQHGYGVTENWVADYRAPAAQALSLATAAASNDSDRSALQLLTNEFEAVKQWSNNLVQAKESMNTAQYAMSPTALRNDPLSQKIISCGRFLGSMLGSAEFKDDGSCH